MIILMALGLLFVFVCCKGVEDTVSEVLSSSQSESDGTSSAVISFVSSKEGEESSDGFEDMFVAAAYEFLEALKNKDVIKLSSKSGVKSPEAYDFFKDIDIESYEAKNILSEADMRVFEVTLSITKSSHELFPVGESKWILKTGSAEDSAMRLFVPEGSNVNPIDYYSEHSKVVKFCERFSTEFGCFGTYTDFKKVFTDTESLKAIDYLASSLCRFLPEVEEYEDDTDDFGYGIPRKWLEEKAEKVLCITGVDLRESKLYIAENDTIEPGFLGANWDYCALVSEEYDEKSRLHTVVIDYYADCVFLVKAKTVKYTVRENEDKSLRLLSTENLYDSGYEVAGGTT